MMTTAPGEFSPHSSHWGAFRARVDPTGRLEVVPHELDDDPYPLIRNVVDAVDHPTRIDAPYARRGWLTGGEAVRGSDSFVRLTWDEASALAARELRRVYDEHGPSAVYGGSYGWASAGRFHHPQSQVHRFLNLLGGYVAGRTNYSLGAAMVIVPHIVGAAGSMLNDSSTWSDIVADCELFIGFGGVATKNAAVNAGGPISHGARSRMRDLAAAGCEIVNVSPLRDDLPDAPSRWLSVRPGTDVALMLALGHVLIETDAVDLDFLERFTVGYPQLRAYILGESDGVAKSPAWAAAICDIAEDEIHRLAGAMSRKRTFISVAPALQRARFGEQPIWMGVALAAMLGGIGLPGRGFSVGHGSMGNYGNQPNLIHNPRLPHGRNPCNEFIPVARIADMLLEPGGTYSFNGGERTYPDIRLVYWAGGNPFHHHQDLFRLHEAFQRPETVIVHDSFWTATARHADLVLPATMTVEREDISGATNEPRIVAMHRIVEPHGLARDDYEIFAAIAAHLELDDAFTQKRTAHEWIELLYVDWAERAATLIDDVPPFEQFWRDGSAAVPISPARSSWLSEFRRSPDERPLQTPSGRIELYSDTIAGFGYDDCPGHPSWLVDDADADYPLVLIANQPATKLHSQLDVGAVSMSSKFEGRETVRLNPDDATELGIAEGDFVLIQSPQGAVIAAAALSDAVRAGAAQLPTGAWFDPHFDIRTCVSGNPNAVTRDIGSSRLGQGCTGQLTRVRVTRYDEPLPPISCRQPPEILGLAGAPVADEVGERP